MREEFGAQRSICACHHCRRNCQFMPGNLIPADLERMIPKDANPFLWAETNLLASKGALVRGTWKQCAKQMIPWLATLV